MELAGRVSDGSYHEMQNTIGFFASPLEGEAGERSEPGEGFLKNTC